MKQILTIFFILFLFNSNLFAQNYEVKGAGTPDVNGIYVPSGKAQGKTKYVKGDYVLFYKGCHAKWMIKSKNGNFYRNKKDTKLPPKTGWEKGCGKGSLNPAPTVVAVSEKQRELKQNK